MIGHLMPESLRSLARAVRRRLIERSVAERPVVEHVNHATAHTIWLIGRAGGSAVELNTPYLLRDSY